MQKGSKEQRCGLVTCRLSASLSRCCRLQRSAEDTMKREAKPLIQRRYELAHAEILLRSSRQQLESGERAHAKVLSGQMRALLFSSKTNSPLLFDLASIVSITPMCIGTRLVPITGPIGEMVGQAPRWVSVPPMYSELQPREFRTWLSTKVLGDFVSLEDRPTQTHPPFTESRAKYSPLDLIRAHANKPPAYCDYSHE